MDATWVQPILTLVGIFAAFAWLRNDIKQLRDDMKDDMTERIDGLDAKLTQRIDGLEANMTQRIDGLDEKVTQRTDGLKDDIQRLEKKVDNLDSRLRVVESEQSRIVGLLEGLGISGVLPERQA